MANMGVWAKQLSGCGINESYRSKTTSEAYSQIKNLGLETVYFEEYDGDVLLKNIPYIDSFIKKYSPCLFIFHPKTPDKIKGYLFHVTNISEVKDWIKKNQLYIKDYSFLITTKITYYENSFVGSVFCDGKGNMLIETVHLPGNINQQKLSQGGVDFERYNSYAIIEDNEIIILEGNYLDRHWIQKITDKYFDKIGYFEFVVGEHCKKYGIYTTGFEFGPLYAFPYEKLNHNIRGRINSVLIR